jgi:prepilin-type N-terminal cleavage/methylation domain-containing protein
MKNPTFRRTRGFTLVELLVVIAIIVVLAAVGFSAGMGALKKAKRIKSQTAATALEQAITQFYNEYGRLPEVGTSGATSDTEYQMTGSDGKALLEVLLAKETGTTLQNPKQIVFLSVQEGKAKGSGGSDGLVYTGTGNTATPQGLYDAFGNPFRVMLDNDYDETIQVTLGGTTAKDMRGRRVAVYSYGSDKKSSTPAEGNDDVKTW